MPKINAPLTDKLIKSLKPKEKEYKKSDGKNLYLFVTPIGRKYFAFEFKSPITQKIRRMALGEYPTLSLAEARERKMELLKQIASGDDPLIIKTSSDTTLKSIAMEWLNIKATKVAKTTLDKQIIRLERHLFPFLGSKEINDITKADIISILRKIEKTGHFETMNRIYMLCSQIWRYAVGVDKVSHNIISDINYQYTFKSGKVKNFSTLTSHDDIKRLLIAVNNYNGDIKTKFALKLAIYTAVRPFNIRSARWDEFDFENGIWQISSEKMKMRETFTLPLSKQAIKLLNEYKSNTLPNDFLFPSIKNGKFMSENTLNLALRRMGFSKDEIVSHGFRAMFSTITNENAHIHGFSPDVIERCLAHKEKDKIREAYNRANYMPLMRGLMQWWADWLNNLECFE
ncbi:tyrosine-type recombinase/integrase [Campylobacter sp. RM16187]|uniref:tyrosine-type recombinase/integrase n=1 Tax=Campylobacter sp. RM16187 TaxID=1660063 RepID=UPI0021B5AC48|nr:tyrosine-type recombinase/integrase [Campylobacter sp. RM16187]QKG29227.1 site-specific recombinase, phage integrase family (DUF4102 domain) [Campylobacter sp. RM16187]